jgi:hypothetical protein
MTWIDPAVERRTLQQSRLLRYSGFGIAAAGVALLAFTDGAALWPAAATMMLGAVVATAGAFLQARLELLRDPGSRHAVVRLMAAFALKAFAIPTVALGGAGFAWTHGPDFPVAFAALALGLGAYVAGLLLRVNGLSRLPEGVPHE